LIYEKNEGKVRRRACSDMAAIDAYSIFIPAPFTTFAHRSFSFANQRGQRDLFYHFHKTNQPNPLIPAEQAV